MNQLDLILENIRLSYTERLLQEAQTDLELVRGQRLINESVMAIRGALVEEVSPIAKIGAKSFAMGAVAPIAGAGIGAGIGALAGEGIHDVFETDSDVRSNLNYSEIPSAIVNGYQNGGLEGAYDTANVIGHTINEPTKYSAMVAGGLLGYGAGIGGALKYANNLSKRR